MKFALCNEVIAEKDFARQCVFSAAIGYQGLEIAPFTLGNSPHNIPARKRRELRRVAADAGISISGLHWLLVSPDGLSITTNDSSVRRLTLEIMRRLIELCADLGGAYLVHGSPAQRRLPEEPKAVQPARERGIEAFAAIASDAEAAGVVYCIEALSTPQANFINTVAEAAEIVDRVGSPAVKTMIDCSAVRRFGKEDIEQLIDRYIPSGHVAHIQVNESNRGAPGQGDDDFAGVFRALRRNGYDRWISVEPLEYLPDGAAVAAFAAGYLKGLNDGVGDM